MNKKIAICFTDTSESAPFRYRCENIVEALKSSQDWEMILCVGDLEKAEKYLNEASILIIERQTDKTGNAKKLIKLAKDKKIKILYDVDDLVFHPRYTLLLTKSTGSRNPFYWFMYSFMNYRLTKRVDGFLCTNQFLAKKLKQNFKKPTYVIPNFLNEKQVSLSKSPKKSDTFTIGYFSGSPTHDEDFALIENQLVRFLNNHKDAKLLVVGDLDLSQKFDFLSAQIVKKPKVDYAKLQDYYAEASVNLAPLVINDFTNCKSELKFFEPAIAETTTLASPTYAFKNSIIDGKTGFLCKDDEWYDKLEYLYAHPEENKKIAKSAKKYCLENYYGDKIKRIIEDVYNDLIDKD